MTTSWLRFPVALRKMWSGGEVQAWLDEHAPAMTATPVPLPDMSDWHSPDRKSITALLHAHAAAVSAATQPAPTDAHVSLAHELWAAAQLAPGEGIADGADRVAAILATQPEGQEAPDHIADVNKMVLDAARYRFLRDNEYASWRPYSLRAGYSATEADALVDAAMSAQAGGRKS